MATTLKELIAAFPHSGRVDWIGLRPARKAAIISVETAPIRMGGLIGDHRDRPGKRAVTLIQSEHLDVIRQLAHAPTAQFADLRRNIAVSGINLLALRGMRISIGSAVLEITGPCAPCSRMEKALGTGAYNAMRGHGGVTAEVISEGDIQIGAEISALSAA